MSKHIIHVNLFCAKTLNVPSLSYSYNEGQTWNTYKFSEDKMRIYGILIDPEEKTTVFSIF
jgi:hypothetical protein